jgi:hypothetical protein
VLDNDEETVNLGAKVSDEATNGAGRGHNGTNEGTDGGETKTADKSSEFRGELEEESGSLGAGNGQSTVDVLANVGQELAGTLGTLDVVSEGGDNLADRDGQSRKETANSGGNRGRELDEESASVLTSGDQEVIGLGADVLEKVTNVGGGFDDGAERSGSTEETEAGNELSDLRGELDEELLGVSANDGDSFLDLRAKVRDDLAALGRCGREGNSSAGEGEGESVGELHCELGIWSEKTFSKRVTRRACLVGRNVTKLKNDCCGRKIKKNSTRRWEFSVK